MNAIIRRACYDDATSMIKAHRRSIREICSKDYSSDQIEVWSGRNFQEEHWHKTMDRDFVWVISDNQNNIFGFGHLKFHENSQAEIAGLYFVPEITGQGFGKKIFQFMLEECRNKDVYSIHLTSTKTAKTFYEGIGFKQLGPQCTLKIGDKDVECFKMLQSLD